MARSLTGVVLTTILTTALSITPIPGSHSTIQAQNKATQKKEEKKALPRHYFDQTTIELLGDEPQYKQMTIEEHLARFPEPVKKEMTAWLVDRRSLLEDGYRRWKFLEHIVAPTYKEMKMPLELGAGIAMTESGTRSSAVSRAGARGIWQIMPGTAKLYGLNPDKAFDPKESTPAHARIFIDYLGKFDGDVPLALAAYNAGPDSVKRRINGKKSFWEARSFLLNETASYSPRAFALVELLVNAPQYNYKPFNGDVSVEVIKLDREMHLDEVSICLNENIWNLENLNPHAKHGELKKGQPLVIPGSYAAEFQSNCLGGERGVMAHLLSKARNHDELVYRVRRGDVLGKISHRYGVSVREIMRRNNIRNANRLRIGQTLYIPQK